MRLKKHFNADGFRMRGTEMARIDGFSDVVFGFALTLLVVSLEVPRTFSELHGLLREFLPFAVSFLLLMMVWYEHYKYFRLYATEDLRTICLNGALLFVVLFYVYPLKFLFLAFFAQTPAMLVGINGRELVLLYNLGFAAIYFLLAAMQANAYRQREELELTPLEQQLTRIYIAEAVSTGAVALLTCGVALLLPPRLAASAMFTYFLIAAVATYFGQRAGKLGRAEQQAEAAAVRKR